MSYSVKDENAIQINSPLPLMYDYKIKDNSVCVQLRSKNETNCAIYSNNGHFIESIPVEENCFSFNLNQFKNGTYKIIITDENHQSETYGMKLENNSCVRIKKLNVNLQK